MGQSLTQCFNERLFARPTSEKCCLPLFNRKLTQCFAFGQREKALGDFSSTKVRSHMLDIDSNSAGTRERQHDNIAAMGNIELDAVSKSQTV